jgi:hypothetical protein
MRGRDWFFNVGPGRDVWINPTSIAFVELERSDEEVAANVYVVAGAKSVITLEGEDAQQLINHLENYGFYAESR